MKKTAQLSGYSSGSGSGGNQFGTVASAHATVSQIITAVAVTINFDTVDSGLGITPGAGWVYKVPSNGTYSFSAMVQLVAGATTTSIAGLLYKNGGVLVGYPTLGVF